MALSDEERRERKRRSAQKYREANRERIRAYEQAYYLEHRDKYIENARSYYERNREKRIAQSAEWKRRNQERHAEHRAAYRASVGEDRHAEMARAWRLSNPEKAAEAQRRYKDSDRGRQAIAVSRNRRRARMADAGAPMTTAEWREVLAEFDHRCAYCHKSGVPLQLEHMVPLVRGGTNARRNIVPACPSCNRSKGVLNAFEFLTKPRTIAS